MNWPVAAYTLTLICGVSLWVDSMARLVTGRDVAIEWVLASYLVIAVAVGLLAA